MPCARAPALTPVSCATRRGRARAVAAWEPGCRAARATREPGACDPRTRRTSRRRERFHSLDLRELRLRCGIAESRKLLCLPGGIAPLVGPCNGALALKEKIEKNPGALKITHQARGRNGMVYDLSAEGHRLTVSIFQRENPQEPGDWRVEARASRADEAIVVSEWGTTRAEALERVGATWAARAEADGLPSFDWKAVATLLDSVRAI